MGELLANSWPSITEEGDMVDEDSSLATRMRSLISIESGLRYISYASCAVCLSVRACAYVCVCVRAVCACMRACVCVWCVCICARACAVVRVRWCGGACAVVRASVCTCTTLCVLYHVVQR